MRPIPVNKREAVYVHQNTHLGAAKRAIERLISEGFYASLESVYEEAIKVITRSGDAAVIENFRPRLRRIVHDTSGIGWGFHDELSRLYREAYPPE